jgi:hypothetical protein
MYYNILVIKIFLVILIIYIIYNIYYKNTICEWFDIDNNKSKSINIIVSRYNEKLEWTNKEPYNKYKYIIYNKGYNDNFEKKYVSNIIKLLNVGRESHTYLYHIVNNYDNLADINVFLPGSIDTSNTIYKKDLFATKILNYIKKYNNAVFLSFGDIKDNDITKEFYNFKVDTYSSTTPENNQQNTELKIRKSEDRPFHNWFLKNIGSYKVKYVIHYGIFSVNKKDILQHPKSYYENLLKLVSDHSNPEDGHYLEKSWAAIFHPFNNTYAIIDPEVVDPLKNIFN